MDFFATLPTEIRLPRDCCSNLSVFITVWTIFLSAISLWHIPNSKYGIYPPTLPYRPVKRCNSCTYEDGYAELYPLNCLKQDDYYFSKRLARCDDSSSEQATRLNAKKSNRRTHYFHVLSTHIVDRCIEDSVGTIAIGDRGGIREDEDGEVKDWGKHGNLDLHSWAFDRFRNVLEYKAEAEGISVERVSERETSKSCTYCGRERKANRVERGLYMCDECGVVANGDVTEAENIRQKVSPSLACAG